MSGTLDARVKSSSCFGRFWPPAFPLCCHAHGKWESEDSSENEPDEETQHTSLKRWQWRWSRLFSSTGPWWQNKFWHFLSLWPCTGHLRYRLKSPPLCRSAFVCGSEGSRIGMPCRLKLAHVLSAWPWILRKAAKCCAMDRSTWEGPKQPCRYHPARRLNMHLTEWKDL